MYQTIKQTETNKMKDFMGLYSKIVSKCFTDCVNDFTSGVMREKEVSGLE